MSLKNLFHDELNFLRLQGRFFAKRNPHLTKFLDNESSDPDVERLLEGFAFLSAKLREKIEDDFPEITHSMLYLLWPNYLRPLPSVTIVKLTPDKSITECQVIDSNSEISSVPIEGLPCLFKTCHDVNVYPLEKKQVLVDHSREKSVIKLEVDINTSLPLNAINCRELDLHLSGSEHNALSILLWMMNYLDHIEVVINGESRRLPASVVTQLGLGSEEALLPYPKNVFDGYRVLQEFLCFPRRFYFFRINQLNTIWPNVSADELTIEFHFTKPLPSDIKVRNEDLEMYCCPAVNLFDHFSDPILLTGKKSEYPILPTGDRSHFDVFSVEKVIGTENKDGKDNDKEKGKERVYTNFESFQHEIERQHGRKSLYYKTKLNHNIRDDSILQTISFIRTDEQEYWGSNETISIDLVCTNRDLPSLLDIGEVSVPTEVSPSSVTFTNVTKPTPSYPPTLDDTLHWTLISNMSLNYLSLINTDSLKNILRTYDFVAVHDVQAERKAKKRLDGIKAFYSEPKDIIIKGYPVRGIESTLELDQDAFLNEGELYLFGTILSHFFSLYSSINSFHQLKVKNLTNNEVYQWGTQKGSQPVI